jgi:hypothetical protein
MYRQVFIPTEQNNVITMPREWYGKEVEVIVFPVMESGRPAKNVFISPQSKRLQEIRSITKDIHVDLSHFKFNRDEANNYD